MPTPDERARWAQGELDLALGAPQAAEIELPEGEYFARDDGGRWLRVRADGGAMLVLGPADISPPAHLSQWSSACPGCRGQVQHSADYHLRHVVRETLSHLHRREDEDGIHLHWSADALR